MSLAVGRRRKIERFAQLLDEASGSPRHHLQLSFDHELLDLVEVAQDLDRLGDNVRPSEPFRAETRALLMATATREGIGVTAKPDRDSARRSSGAGATKALARQPATTVRPGRTRVRVRGAILIGLAVGTLALSGMSAASGSAMPGDPLYGIKRSQEGAQLALASSDADRGRLYLEFAHIRLSEAETIKSNSTLLKSTLADMDRETKQGASLLITDAIAHRDAAPLSTIDEFVKSQSADIDILLNSVAPASRQPVVVSSTIAGLAGVRSADVRAVLGCTTIPKRAADEFGPTVAPTCTSAARIDPTPPLRPRQIATAMTQASETPMSGSAGWSGRG